MKCTGLLTLFFGVVANDFVIVGKVGSKLALEAGCFLGAELASLLSGTGHLGLEPIQLVFDAIDDLCLVFCDVWVRLGG